jgi:dipeptidyl aminopeptidase/acylaminoacyl peptidase
LGKDDFALVSESWRATRLGRMPIFSTRLIPIGSPTLLFERNTEDRYSNPAASSSLRMNTDAGYCSLTAAAASFTWPDPGHLRKATVRLWMSSISEAGKPAVFGEAKRPTIETPVRLIDADRQLVITRRESNEVHPNFFLRDMRRNRLTQITELPDPFPQLRNVYKEMVHYDRNDGVPLSGTLYLPEGYRIGVDDPLPTILWAYPREFKSADAAGQVSGSPYTYTRIGVTSPVILVTQGYAVLDNASFPIVGEGDEEPNDTFVDQLVANGQAAIDKLVEMGVTDPDRVGVSGHSYGAFMTANLLSHSDAFAAGVARSGAYNRSLTPFGFQAEERTYWQAPEVYHTMSPFSFAHQMKTPMLIIHGSDDNNSGTFPMQSERYYDALRGHGAITRLVMLPHESHGYRARESVLHMHYEWLKWFDRYVKNRSN